MKVTPNQNIKPINPLKRNCYFDYEHPPGSPLKAHEMYSQVTPSSNNMTKLGSKYTFLQDCMFLGVPTGACLGKYDHG